MRPLQRRGPRGRGEKNAPASGATSWRLRAWRRRSHFFFCHSCESRNPGSLCSCRGGISCRPKRPPRNGKRHETEGRMRCGHYRGGVPEGEGQKNAPASGATSWRLRAGLRHGHFFFCHSCESRNPGSLCSCRGGISCRPKRPPRNGSAMRRKAA